MHMHTIAPPHRCANALFNANFAQLHSFLSADEVSLRNDDEGVIDVEGAEGDGGDEVGERVGSDDGYEGGGGAIPRGIRATTAGAANGHVGGQGAGQMTEQELVEAVAAARSSRHFGRHQTTEH